MRSYSICLSLTYFTEHNTLKVHPYCPKLQNFLFLWLNSSPLCAYVCVFVYTSVSFIHSFTDGYLVCLHVLTTISNDHDSTYNFLRYCCQFLWINTQRWNCCIYGCTVFNFLRNIHDVFYGGYTNLHSHQQCKRVLFSSHSDHHLLFLVCFIKGILAGVRWYLIVVLIFISLISDIEHLFK